MTGVLAITLRAGLRQRPGIEPGFPVNFSSNTPWPARHYPLWNEKRELLRTHDSLPPAKRVYAVPEILDGVDRRHGKFGAALRAETPAALWIENFR